MVSRDEYLREQCAKSKTGSRQQAMNKELDILKDNSSNHQIKACLHEHQVLNPDSNLHHNPHERGGLSLDLNPACLQCKRNKSGSGSGSEST